MKKEYEVILGAHVIDEQNRKTLEDVYGKDAMPSNPSNPAKFEIGNIVVLRTIKADDLFDDRFGNKLDSVYITTLEEFDARFVIIDSPHNYETFSLINYK